MKSLKFIFDALSDLNRKTKLLEACGWDEERSESLFEKTSNEMYEIFKSNKAKSWDELKSLVASFLSDEFNSQEITVMLEIIEEVAQKSFLSKDDRYDN